MKNFKNITVVGAGYVGCSVAALFGRKKNVKIVDIDKEKIEKLNKNICPVNEPEISKLLDQGKIKLKATDSIDSVIDNTDLFILALPSDYDPQKNFFDTSIIELALKKIFMKNRNIPIVIRSTVPVGFTKRMRERFKSDIIIFSPEFLREGRAYSDNVNPSRIVIGDKTPLGREIGNLFSDFSQNKPGLFFLESGEAESVKLFSNSYLALRVSYFNELDSFCLNFGMDTKKIIEAVCADPRIGDGYNNPSFGYGGYCLPKDTKQLLANYESVPQNIIESIVKSNSSRKDFISEHILKRDVNIIGIYRLTMKEGSGNIRESSIQGIIKRLKAKGVKIIIFEPLIEEDKFFGSKVENDFKKFKKKSDLIIANRAHEDLSDCLEKVYSRDLFSTN